MSRDDPRRPPVNGSQHEVFDDTADKAHDAIEFANVPPEEVVSALREAADEIEHYYAGGL